MLSCGADNCDFTQLNNNSMPGAAIVVVVVLTDEKMIKKTVGYETQGPSPSFRADSRAMIFEFPIFSKLRSGLCFYISPRIK